jgi:hypothetical protein
MSHRHSMKRGESSRAVISHDLRIDDPGRTNVPEDDNAVRTDESHGHTNVHYGDSFGGPSRGSILGGYRNKNTVINKRSTVINKQYSKSECILLLWYSSMFNRIRPSNNQTLPCLTS